QQLSQIVLRLSGFAVTAGKTPVEISQHRQRCIAIKLRETLEMAAEPSETRLIALVLQALRNLSQRRDVLAASRIGVDPPHLVGDSSDRGAGRLDDIPRRGRRYEQQSGSDREQSSGELLAVQGKQPADAEEQIEPLLSCAGIEVQQEIACLEVRRKEEP